MSDLVPGPHQTALKRAVAERIAERTRDEWAAFGAERDVCIEPVLDPDELTKDPHLVSRGLFFSIPTSRGPSPQVRTPITPAGAESLGAPPRMGEHTRAILRDGGLSDDEIAALLASGAARANDASS